MGGDVGSWDRMIEMETEISQVEWGSVLVGMRKEEREIAST